MGAWPGAWPGGVAGPGGATCLPLQSFSHSRMSGRVGDLSPKQAEILTEFRGRIQDVLAELPAQHDHYLLRWLRDGHVRRRSSRLTVGFEGTFPKRTNEVRPGYSLIPRSVPPSDRET
ncbi:SEC14-like protein 3 [Liparis tanakae]|uniref:SEC14-like protein 3 n=1 Tax=Liparis tanakae TaxID=230148 RepID=A0A4Z2EF39_9TELE|nr:SEC14-like protein 3 [Liparis tanakae]